jgi:hypothetical protein
MAQRIALAMERVQRPEAVLCVAGEFKKGKSSLANAIAGADVCPVDDDIATSAITVLRFGTSFGLTVRRREGGQTVTEHPPMGELAAYATEGEDPTRRAAVELVEMTIPSPVLERGLIVVDTPGLGSVNPAHGAAILGFLPTAEAVLFVTDASAELSGPEIDFLQRSRELGPRILVALTKIDLFAAWREIAEIDNDRLRALGMSNVVPVSSRLRAIALSRADLDLNIESGIPALLAMVSQDVVNARRDLAFHFALSEARTVLEQVRMPLEAASQAAGSRGPQYGPASELAAVHARIAYLRGPGSHWVTRLNDGFAELNAEVDHAFRGGLRRLQRTVEEDIDRVDPASAWTDISSQLQQQTTEVVQDAYARVMSGTDLVRSSVLEVLAETDLDLPTGERARGIDIATMWTARPLTGSTLRVGAGAAFGMMRGAQGGMLMLGTVSNLVGLVVAGPVLAGAAVVFGARQLIEDRHRQLAARRQDARTIARQFLDDVQFETSARLRDLTRELHQRLRDHVTLRIDELLRTYAETARTLEVAIQQDESARHERASSALVALARIDALANAVHEASL